jgi:hypothetical protein
LESGLGHGSNATGGFVESGLGQGSNATGGFLESGLGHGSSATGGLVESGLGQGSRPAGAVWLAVLLVKYPAEIAEFPAALAEIKVLIPRKMESDKRIDRMESESPVIQISQVSSAD